ncbi:Rieske (2Fe-2S) protein [Kutzneria buriramensis]|uniref:Nitrite reductase/ring-hydroxylating ferredoxin subunit n=1 Tax=Kutzneria buriramensis TaxID=1045776 RepID=A0A3E0HGH9_9PSEU|nr:Rieske (2Fe-2S) protein [Kutzneria buriramensis]REH44783.1 nitrite reductase/ring-hydroxylating ferredoxin subunit [Kutzneria buriramensis]
MTTPEVIANPNRRQVLCGLVAALVAGGAVTTACSSASTSDASGPANNNQPKAAAGTEVAKLADVPVGGGTLVDEPGGTGKLLLVQPSAGQVKAFSAACPHQGVTVGTPQGGTITCPGHGSQFDASTGALKRGPATTGLTAVDVKVNGAAVVLA